MKKIQSIHGLQIFTTGAFLKPMKLQDDNGRITWIWYVSEFIDDSYKDGSVYNPNETSTSKEGLLSKID
jgi:hypothetical protein